MVFEMALSRIKRVYFKEVKKKIEIGTIFVTRYERARIIGARALQISLGAPILIDIANIELDAMRIAEQELYKGILPLTVRRMLPSGKFQDIPLSWLALEDGS